MNDTLPSRFIIFDTEYTSWKGAQERGWSGRGEYREVIQIGAVKVEDLKETDSFLRYVRPLKNPTLSNYIQELTGIRQIDIDERGIPYKDAQARLYEWSEGCTMYCFGADGEVLRENSELHEIPFPFSGAAFVDVREVFERGGIDTSAYMSSTIPKAFGVPPPPNAHDALNDARSILLGLQKL